MVPTPTRPFQRPLLEGDVVDVDHFDAVGHPPQDARLMDEPLRGQKIANAHAAVAEDTKQ